MAATRIHMLNVREGDCYIFERADSGHATMIDICCGNLAPEAVTKARLAEAAKPLGNYGMCNKPTNPIEYLRQVGIRSIFRFILTHPDMDHMDGIRALFESVTVHNFWDCGIRREEPDFSTGRYLREDWAFYQDLINSRVASTTIVKPRAGSQGKYWNCDDDDGNGGGDFLNICAPCPELVAATNQGNDINDGSYVIVYRHKTGPIIWAGDSNDKTWEYILEHHSSLVKNAAVLFAPHHGRKSDRDYGFLDTVKPRISFFGCAPSENLAYSAWQYRKLLYFTNNQCGNSHIYPYTDRVDVFIENETYARDYAGADTYQKDGYWFLCSA